MRLLTGVLIFLSVIIAPCARAESKKKPPKPTITRQLDQSEICINDLMIPSSTICCEFPYHPVWSERGWKCISWTDQK